VTQTPVVLFVSFLALPGQEEALRRELLWLAERSLTEPGCQRYDVHQDLDAPDRIWLYEQWAGPVDLEQHDQTTHVAKFVADLPMLARLPFEKWRTSPLPG
jgi:quinol monooxygenase YgiN